MARGSIPKIANEGEKTHTIYQLLTSVSFPNMPTREMLENRIVELVFCPWQELPDRLKKLGLSVDIQEDGESIIIDNGRQKHGLTDVDPPTKAVMISAAISGSARRRHLLSVRRS